MAGATAACCDKGADGASAGPALPLAGDALSTAGQGGPGAARYQSAATAQLHLGVPPRRYPQLRTIRRLSESLYGFWFALGGRIRTGRHRPGGRRRLRASDCIHCRPHCLSARNTVAFLQRSAEKCRRIATRRRIRLQRNPSRPPWLCSDRQGYAGRVYRVRFEYRPQATGFGEDR